MVGELTSACLNSAVGFVDIAGGVTVGVTYLAVLAGGVTVGVTTLADAGVAPLADAEVASLAVIWVASLTIAGVASPAHLAGGVTVGVASPAIAGVASLADLAEGVTVGVASPVVAGVASLAVAGVASMAVAGVASLVDSAEVVPSADVAENVAIAVTFLADPVGVVTEKMTVRDGLGALDGSICDCGDCCDASLVYRNVRIQVIGVVAPVGRFWSTQSVLSPVK